MPSTVGIIVGQLADAFKKEIARRSRSPQVSDAARPRKTSLPPWGSGGRFNCWPAFRFGTTETIRPPRFKLRTLSDLVHAGRTTGKADKTGRVSITGAGRSALEGLSAEPETVLGALTLCYPRPNSSEYDAHAVASIGVRPWARY